MGMTAKTCSRLPELRQGQALFLLSWAAYATAYVGRYNYSAVMGAVTAEGTLSLSAAGGVKTAPGNVAAAPITSKTTDASPTSVVFYSLRIALFSASAISRRRGAAWAKNCRNAAQK